MENEKELLENLDKITKVLQEIYKDIKKIVGRVITAVKELFKEFVVGIVKQLNKDKKACKTLHIWLHTKKKRIRKKQSKRLNKIILSYMPF